MKNLFLASVLTAAAAITGAVQAHPLEARVLGCMQAQPVVDAAYDVRVNDVPIEVAFNILVEDPTLSPAQRFIVANLVQTLYSIEVEHLPTYEHYRVLSFTICVESIGNGFIELESTGDVLQHKRSDL